MIPDLDHRHKRRNKMALRTDFNREETLKIYFKVVETILSCDPVDPISQIKNGYRKARAKFFDLMEYDIDTAAMHSKNWIEARAFNDRRKFSPTNKELIVDRDFCIKYGIDMSDDALTRFNKRKSEIMREFNVVAGKQPHNTSTANIQDALTKPSYSISKQTSPIYITTTSGMKPATNAASSNSTSSAQTQSSAIKRPASETTSMQPIKKVKSTDEMTRRELLDFHKIEEPKITVSNDHPNAARLRSIVQHDLFFVTEIANNKKAISTLTAEEQAGSDVGKRLEQEIAKTSAFLKK